MDQTNLTTIQPIGYALQAQGYVHHWLVAGTQAIAVADLTLFDQHHLQQEIATAYHQPHHPVTQSPGELTTLIVDDAHGEAQFPWRAVCCGDDHFVDYSSCYPTCHYLRTWAYSELAATAEQTVSLVLTTHGPADLWLNDELVHQHRHFHQQMPPSVAFNARLRSGQNKIVVCFTQVADGDCAYSMALQVTGNDPAALTVQLPTTLNVVRRQKLQAIFDAAYLDKDLYHRDDEIIIRWPQELQLTDEIGLRLQTPTGRIYTEGQPTVKGGTEVKLGKAYQHPDGIYWVTVMPTPEEYHVHGMRVARHLPLHIANSKFAETTYGSYAERQREALLDASGRAANSYSEIAKMALGRWDYVKADRLVATIAHINQRATGSDRDLVGLLGALLRYGDAPAFPTELKREIEHVARNFDYGLEESQPSDSLATSESHQILWHTCAVLAGQLFPEQHFSVRNQSGRWHQHQGEESALAWLRQRAQGGFREWDAPVTFEEIVIGLSHLADLSENVELAEMATVVLDKVLYTLALNSFQGVFGSTHGCADTPSIKSGRVESTNGISRLLWGVGAFTGQMAGTVSLACAQSYEVPPPIYEIGATPVEELWSKERHTDIRESGSDQEEALWEVNKVTYKTPDFMLCSAQDYRAGLPGDQEHIWQATLGLDAIVFVNHPACMSQANGHRPNFWRGNAILPRVAQWKDGLIALYTLPADDWMGFTHAYFPTAHFDEYLLREGWAFARKGDGYLALMATAGLTLTTSGDNAYRELRAYGQEQGWFCQLGRAALDGSFDEFQSKMIALDITFEQFAFHATTLRGESLDFGWKGPLLVNEIEQPLHQFHHYDSPFCVSEVGADGMEIRAWQSAIQLDFRQHSLDNYQM